MKGDILQDIEYWFWFLAKKKCSVMLKCLMVMLKLIIGNES